MKKLRLLCLCLVLAGCGRNDAVYQGKSAGTWVRALKSPETRSDAFRALEEMGPAAIPALIDGLKHEDAAVREGAAVALRKNGKEAVPALVEALKHPTEGVRKQAAYVLGEIGPEAGAAVVPLIETLKDPNVQVRIYAARALWKVDNQGKTAVTTFSEALRDPEAGPVARRLAIDNLGELGPHAQAAQPALTTALKDSDVQVRLYAARALWKVDPRQSKSVAATLNAVLNDAAAPLEVRRLAIDTLAELGKDAREASPALTKLLGDPNVYVRVKAARALWAIDGQALPIADTLRKSLAYDDPKDADSAAVRSWAAYVLGELGIEGKQAYPELLKALSDKDETVRRQAANALARLADPTDRLDPEPLQNAALRKDEAVFVRVNAARALWKVDKSKAKLVTDVLLAALKEPGADTRRLAIETLADIGPEAAKVGVGALNAALQDKSPEVRRAAADALPKMGADAKGGLASLTDALKDSDAEVRIRAARAIWTIDNTKTLTVVPVLIRALNDRNQSVRAWAAWTLGQIGPKAIEAVPELRKNLGSPDENVRKQAAYALGRIGREAREALPTLIGLARSDPNQSVREQAGHAVWEIDPVQARAAGIP
jgi:HEAT repeat protein